MTFQLLLTLFFVGLAFYFYRQKQSRRFRFVLPVYVICCAGVFFSWAPDVTSDIAKALGIGRGTDLIMYLFLLSGTLALINVHLKFLELGDTITELARKIALVEADSQFDRDSSRDVNLKSK
jgi:hypothetical protein